MKTLVIYESLAGHTKAYAEAIAKAVDATILPLKKFKKKMIPEYDTIVFGGWVRGSQIQGLNDFLSYWDEMEGKDVIVFATGMSIASSDVKENLINVNVLYPYHLRFYLFQGGFDYGKLTFKERLLFSTALKQMEGQGDNPALTEMLESATKAPMVYFDQPMVDRVVKVINDIALKKAQQ